MIIFVKIYCYWTRTVGVIAKGSRGPVFMRHSVEYVCKTFSQLHCWLPVVKHYTSLVLVQVTVNAALTLLLLLMLWLTNNFYSEAPTNTYGQTQFFALLKV